MDPISDMIISIKHGGLARKESVVIPYSKLKFAVAAQAKAVKGITAKWTGRRVSTEIDPDDPDSFDLLDRLGSGDLEAMAAEAEPNLSPAPCGRCPIDSYRGSIWECLLETNPVLALFGHLPQTKEFGELSEG